MRTLTVSKFSCIDEAVLELGRLTLIIGPQASGKSVLCKLCYFLFDVAHQQQASVTKLHSFEKFTGGVKDRFLEWFPVEAWGKNRFKIELVAGDYSVCLTRKTYAGKVSDDFRIKFSDEFKQQYAQLLADVEKVVKKTESEDIQRRISIDYQFYEATTKSIAKLMGKDRVAYQAFVPAGRSFFTSIGKAIAAFEQGRVLDPLILRFGRLYTAYKDRPRRFLHDEKSSDHSVRRGYEAKLAELLGGVIEQDGDKEYLRTNDGRKIPLSALSSGQQELLPLITFFPWLNQSAEDRLCYIEEPEAHLFPASQAQLIETLVAAAHTGVSGSTLVMTTHSPYVVTKVNNLLKAGAIGRRANEDQKRALDGVVSRRAWLTARNVRAYAIKDGALVSILDVDGLIDADYLDEVSSTLSREFSKILEVEESRD